MNKEFIIFSQYGFFVGLKKGGIPVWDFDPSKAKPFVEPEKLAGLRRLLPQEELLIEYL